MTSRKLLQLIRTIVNSIAEQGEGNSAAEKRAWLLAIQIQQILVAAGVEEN